MAGGKDNWIYYIIAGVIGLLGLKAVASSQQSTTDTSGYTQPKKFGCGCNKGQ